MSEAHPAEEVSNLCGPFTEANVRKVLDDVLTDRYVKPLSHLDYLIQALNFYHWTFALSVTNATKAKARAQAVHGAIEILDRFFDDRRREWCPPWTEGEPGAKIVANEMLLYTQYCEFRQVMAAHNFNLRMDAGLLMPPLESWRQIAEGIDGAFVFAMSQANAAKPLGLSNGGPRARFVSAVVPKITGETPSVDNVAKQLKDIARGVRRNTRPARQKTGTNDK